MSDQSKITSEPHSDGEAEDRRCHVQAAKVCDVELLDAYSHAIETVVEGLWHRDRSEAISAAKIRIRRRGSNE